MRLTLKAIDDELRRLGHDVHLEKGDGYFYFWKLSGKVPQTKAAKPKSRSTKPNKSRTWP